jgi:hypothetical protein
MKKNQNTSSRKRPLRKHPRELQIDLASLLSIDHVCEGCNKGEKCCCAMYEVCVTAAEMKRIIRVLPEATKFCSHLETGDGYDNVFEAVGQGLFAIDTTEDGLCLFAFRSKNKIRCSLHAAAASLGLPLEQVKPKACLLWPIMFSEGKELLSLTEDALSFSCNSKRGKTSRRLSPSLLEAITLVYGSGMGSALEREARKSCRGRITL